MNIPVKFEQCGFCGSKDICWFSIFSSGGHFVQWTETVEGQQKTFLVVSDIKEKVNAHTYDGHKDILHASTGVQPVQLKRKPSDFKEHLWPDEHRTSCSKTSRVTTNTQNNTRQRVT